MIFAMSIAIVILLSTNLLVFSKLMKRDVRADRLDFQMHRARRYVESWEFHQSDKKLPAVFSQNIKDMLKP